MLAACGRETLRGWGRAAQDLLPVHFGAIAAALLDELEACGVNRQGIGLLVDNDFALQGTVKLCGHGGKPQLDGVWKGHRVPHPLCGHLKDPSYTLPVVAPGQTT